MSTFAPFPLASFTGKLLYMKNTSPNFTDEQIGLLRRNLCAELSEDDFALFIQACNRTGLDPFARHIYPMPKFTWCDRKQKTSHVPEASIDGLRACAERTGKYNGQIGPQWCGLDGSWKDVWTAQEPPIGARVGILRSDFQNPTWGVALFAEYLQIENGQPARLWGKMAAQMLAKCAEALGLRKAFPNELGGLYAREEMAQAMAGRDVGSSGGRAEATTNGTTDRRMPYAVKSPVPISGNPQGTSDPEVVYPAAGAGTLHSRPVPSELKPFCDRAMERTTVIAALKYLKDEMSKTAGAEGLRIYQRITMRVPRTFSTREECAAANIECWLDLWDQLQRLKNAHDFAKAVNS